MKIEELQRSLEARELLIIERGAERTMQQALQVHIKSHGKDKKKWKKSKEKWLKSVAPQKKPKRIDTRNDYRVATEVFY
jgi:hypothetical protein